MIIKIHWPWHKPYYTLADVHRYINDIEHVNKMTLIASDAELKEYERVLHVMREVLEYILAEIKEGT